MRYLPPKRNLKYRAAVFLQEFSQGIQTLFILPTPPDDVKTFGSRHCAKRIQFVAETVEQPDWHDLTRFEQEDNFDAAKRFIGLSYHQAGTAAGGAYPFGFTYLAYLFQSSPQPMVSGHSTSTVDERSSNIPHAQQDAQADCNPLSCIHTCDCYRTSYR